MVTRIGIRALRDNLTSTIRRVRAGEQFEVTHDGESVALLSPVPRERLARLVAHGLATPPSRPFELPEPVPTTGLVTATEALEDDRNGR
jgi:antitoxin (DNA-binding transcriptional repressor) of toxin-antitoxin stability system